MRSDAAAVDRALAALSDPTRRGVIGLLRKKPRRAGELARAMRMSAPAMSRHLKVLRKAGLVSLAHPAGDQRVRVYRLRREPFSALRGWLDEVESFWSDQLDAFKAHVERAR